MMQNNYSVPLALAITSSLSDSLFSGGTRAYPPPGVGAFAPLKGISDRRDKRKAAKKARKKNRNK